MLLKVSLKVHRDAKSCPLKHEYMSALSSAPSEVQGSADGAIINTFEGVLDRNIEDGPKNTPKMHLKCAFQDLNKGVQGGTFMVTLKKTLELLLSYTYSCTCQCKRMHKMI